MGGWAKRKRGEKPVGHNPAPPPPPVTHDEWKLTLRMLGASKYANEASWQCMSKESADELADLFSSKDTGMIVYGDFRVRAEHIVSVNVTGPFTYDENRNRVYRD